MTNKKDNSIDATHLLMDKDIERILLGTYGKSRSALELSELYGIPIATCFRKIKQLRKMGLLEVNNIYSENGKNIELFSANLDNAYVYYDSGNLKVRFKIVLQMANDFRRRYEQFAEKSAVPRR